MRIPTKPEIDNALSYLEVEGPISDNSKALIAAIRESPALRRAVALFERESVNTPKEDIPAFLTGILAFGIHLGMCVGSCRD